MVADEVRSLAPRTQRSAQDIHQMIVELQAGARDAVEGMQQSLVLSGDSARVAKLAGHHLAEITQRIGTMDGISLSVAAATEEQTAVVESLNQDIVQVGSLHERTVSTFELHYRSARNSIESRKGSNCWWMSSA